MLVLRILGISTLVFGISSSIATAQDASEAAVRTEVRAAWDAYIDAFSAGRTDVVANDVYAAPSYQLGADGANLRLTAAETKAVFDATHQALATERYDRTETNEVEICVLNSGAALLTARFTRYRTDDSVIMTGASAYVFAKVDGAWRIVAIMSNPGSKLIACD